MKDIQGVQRGKCNSCECEEFRASPNPQYIRCEYCNHTPGEHVKIVELGACQKCGQDNCDKYVSEDPNSYTDCQYCGCSASCHAGADALRKTQPKPPPTQSFVPMTTPIPAVAAGPRGPPPPQTGGGIQPRMMPGGQPVQTNTLGTCTFPGCPYPRRTEGNRVHDYCSRTCAQKHQQMKSSFHQQKAAAAQQAANMGTGHQLPAQVQAQQRVPNPGGPAHMVATTTSGMGSGPAPGLTPGPAPTPPGQKLCSKCNTRPPNPGRGWCQECYTAMNG